MVTFSVTPLKLSLVKAYEISLIGGNVLHTYRSPLRRVASLSSFIITIGPVTPEYVLSGNKLWLGLLRNVDSTLDDLRESCTVVSLTGTSLSAILFSKPNIHFKLLSNVFIVQLASNVWLLWVSQNCCYASIWHKHIHL